MSPFAWRLSSSPLGGSTTLLMVSILASGCGQTHERPDSGARDSGRDGRVADTAVLPPDGSCVSTVVCRPSTGPCDLEELSRCDGSCPPDATIPDGEVCSLDGVCVAGVCEERSTCIEGAACTTGLPCEEARVTCMGGVARCVATGVAPAGLRCASANACQSAAVCDGERAECPVEYAPAGSPCPGGECDGLGRCVTTDCSGLRCDTGIPCEMGELDCSTGSPVCVGVGSEPEGTPCGPDGFCDAFGMCATPP